MAEYAHPEALADTSWLAEHAKEMAIIRSMSSKEGQLNSDEEVVS